MAFVREIIQTNTLVTMKTLQSELPLLHDNFESLKTAVFENVEGTYIKLLKRPHSVFTTQVQELTNQANLLQTNINEVVKVEVDLTKTDIIKCKDKLHSLNENLKMCYDINHRCEQLLEAQQYIDKKSYIKAATIYKDLESIPINTYGNIMLKLKDKAALAQFGFVKVTLNEVINSNIKYSMKQDDDRSVHSLSFLPKNSDMEEAIIAYSIILIQNVVPDILDYFGKVIEKMLTCIVEFSSQLELTANECTLKANNPNNQVKNNYEVVFSNLIRFARFLESNLNYDTDKQSILMNYLQDSLQENLCKLIIKHCLEDTIPSNAKGLQYYSDVQISTAALQSTLIQIGLLDSKNTQLVDFTLDVKLHFIQKKCQQYKIIAANTMKKDLHNTTIVGKPYDPNDLSFDGFPQCAISKSVWELVDMIKEIIQKASTCADEYSGNYLATTNDILTMYEKQEHHKRLLMTIPQQMAIFHNNCKYITYELSAPNWITSLSSSMKNLEDFGRFTVARQHLNDTAVQMLETLRAEQVEHIKERIDSSGIHLACDRLEPAVEKAVRQCLRQQELLKTVWQKVLNYYDYNKTMGILLDALCKCLITNIMSIQDLPSDIADQLGDILKLVLVRGPKLFMDHKEIHMYAIHWDKLNELIFVLNANLNLIGERWADGKGPIALHFTAAEIRGLIRALFQNSDERAYLLSKIN